VGAPVARSAPGPTAAAAELPDPSLECPILCVSDRGPTGSLGRVEQGRIQMGARSSAVWSSFRRRRSGEMTSVPTTAAGSASAPIRSVSPAEGCTFVAVFMTAAHLILVWEQRDDPNLLHHAQRAKEVGRNPRSRRTTALRSSASYYAWEAAGGPVHGVRARDRAAFSRSLTVGVEEELMILDPKRNEQRPASHVLIQPSP